MGTFHTVLKFIVGHVLAGAVIILGTLFVTLVCYVVGLATAPQGIDNPVAVIPEFLALMFLAGVFAVAASTCSFLISAFLQWLRSKQYFPVWLPLFVVPLLTSLVAFLAFGRTGDRAFGWIETGMTFVYFGIYWTLLTSSAAVLDFLRRKLSGQKAA